MFHETLGKNLGSVLKTTGSFSTEFGAFTAWELVEGTYQGAKLKDPKIKEMWAERLSLASGWDRLLFLMALRAGGTLSHPLAEATHRSLREHFNKTRSDAISGFPTPSGYPEGLGPRWAFAGPNKAKPLLMSSEDGSGKKAGGRNGAGEEPKTLKDQKALDTVMIPGRKGRSGKRKISPQVHQDNLETLRNWESDPEFDLGAVAQNFDPKGMAESHLFEGGSTWVRFYFQKDGSLFRILDHPARDPRFKNVFPTPPRMGIPVDVLLAPDGQTPLWYDPYLPDSRGILGGVPLEALESLMDATRTKRRDYFRRRPFDVEVAIARTGSHRAKDSKAGDKFGKMALDFMEAVYSRGIKGEPEMVLYLYRSGTGEPGVGLQPPKGSRQVGTVRVRVLMEGEFSGLRGVQVQEFSSGNLDSNFVYRFEQMINYTNQQFGFIRERYELGETQKIPIKGPEKDSKYIQTIKEWWQKLVGGGS